MAVVMGIDTSTPVLILGGRENTVAAARSLGRIGVKVRISGLAGCVGMSSRYCHQALPIPEDRSTHDSWRELLLSPDRRDLDGHVLFACCDDSLEFITENRDELKTRYILEDFVPELRRAMADKKHTLELARQAGIPTPNFWSIDCDEDVFRIREDVRFPVMVKPLHSHIFAPVFGRKLFIVKDSFDEVVEKVQLARKHGHDVMVVEMVPGPDDLLSSYYSYVDDSGQNLYHYTKRVVRRWPLNRGGCCHHITEWLPETAELGRRFFASIGWRGIVNIEFKRDVRDGQLKVIEVNPRFTAAHRLVLESGAPIDIMIYCRLTGQEGPTFSSYKQGLRMWYLDRDLMALLEMRKAGKITLSEWLRSVMFHHRVAPYFAWSDPMPAVANTTLDVGRTLRKAWRKLSGQAHK